MCHHLALWDEENRLPVVDAITDLITGPDVLLLNYGLHESSVSHRLAMSLEGRYGLRSVDCEYSRVYLKTDMSPGWHPKKFDRRKVISNLSSLRDSIVKHDVGIFRNARLQTRDYFDRAKKELTSLKKNGAMKWARPDIVVHERRSDAENFLVLELKLGTGDKCRVPMDLSKLVEFTTNPIFRYQYGLFLSFGNQEPYLICAILFVHGLGFVLNSELKIEKKFYPLETVKFECI